MTHPRYTTEATVVAVGVIQFVGDRNQAIQELCPVEQLVESAAASWMVTAVQTASLESGSHVSVDVQVVEAVVLATEILDNWHNRWIIHRITIDLLVQHGLHVARLDRLC